MESAAVETGLRYTRMRRLRTRTAWLFLLPMLVVLAAVAGWPLIRTIWFGFTDAQLSDLAAAEFIGLANYLDWDDAGYFGLLADPDWWLSVWNTIRFAVVSVTAETVLGLAIAMALNVNFPGKGLLRTAILVPWAIPTIVSARMWNWMLNDQFGIINDILMKLGIISTGIPWTADPSYATWAVIMVDVWKTTPFMALLLLAGLQSLPTDCYESARVEGIKPINTFLYVTLPLMWPVIVVAVIFRLLDALRVFDLIYVLTAGSKATMSMSVYARQQLIDFQEVGYGSAASTLLFLTIGILMLVYLKLTRSKLGKD
ncbi:MAG: sugar ABC transporter permease [Planctomycetes bacterium]|nr:sugar ABC transporter permease [Planctomycetota bacterium]MCD7897930.1 sugar ABC transporter permease [Planctomycetaceae bacterium]